MGSLQILLALFSRFPEEKHLCYFSSESDTSY